MGNSGSNPAGESYDNNDEDDFDDPFDGIDTLGYRVLGVQPNSPASSAGLVSFLDFLVGADNKMLLGSGEDLEPGQEYDDVDLPALLDQKKGSPIELLVWNIKSQTARLVDIVPSDTWGGAGLLGVTIRIDNYAGAEDRLVRVLSIESHKSPAAIAGLIPEKDYLLGTTHQTLDSVDRLAEVLRQHEDEVVELYVYNTDDDMVRVVALLPTSSWEGSRGGLLGAEVGTGYLHRLPHTSRFTSGSSIERKVRYVDVGQSGDTTTNGTEERATESEKRTKILEMEPQLEMEPAEDEESDSQPMIAPKVPTDAPRSSSIPVAQQQSNVNAVPALIFTPIAQESSPSNGGSQSYGGANSPLPPPRQTTGTPSPKVGISPRNSITAVRYPPIPYLQTAAYPSPMAHRANPVSVFSQPPPIQPPSGGSISTSSYGQPNFNVAPAAIVPTHSYNSTNHGALPFMSLPPPPAPQVSLTSQRH